MYIYIYIYMGIYIGTHTRVQYKTYMYIYTVISAHLDIFKRRLCNVPVLFLARVVGKVFELELNSSVFGQDGAAATPWRKGAPMKQRSRQERVGLQKMRSLVCCCARINHPFIGVELTLHVVYIYIYIYLYIYIHIRTYIYIYICIG